MKKSLIIILTLLGLLISFDKERNQIFAQENEEPIINGLNLSLGSPIPGKIEGTGTYFEIKDSEYLNITLKSSKEIKVVLESIPKIVSMDIEAVREDKNAIVLTIEGLEPGKTYYQYQDSYKNEAIFISDKNGRYTWTQDLTQPHHIWIQETKGTTFINQDTTLNHNITGSVEISVDNVTLDCNNYSIIGDWSGYGIHLDNRKGVIIKNCQISKFSYGIDLYQSLNNQLITNNLFKNSYGIYLNSSSENTITNDTLSNNFFGIYLNNSSLNTISNNNFSENAYGVHLESSSNNTIDGNSTSSNNQTGIYLAFSSNNTVVNNTCLNDGLIVWDSYSNTVKNNTINSKPLVYLEEASNVKISENVGQVILVNCDNIQVENLNLSNTSIALELWQTNNSQIINNNFSNNIYGIYLYSSSNNEIKENVSSNNKNGYGIALQFSSNNTILNNNFLLNAIGIKLDYLSNNNTLQGNIISNNTSLGIQFFSASGNTITKNNLLNNRFAIAFLSSSAIPNNFYLNNFIGNTYNVYYYNAYYYSSDVLGKWNSLEKITYTYNNNSYTDYLGNYWSNYQGDDTNNDGIIDLPYILTKRERDNYPLLQPFENYKIGLEASVCGNNICETGESFENCYQDCIEEGIEKYFPYYYFSAGEKYYPTSFYFDGDANVENNHENYDAQIGIWNKPYIYVHPVEDENYFTIQYWLYSTFSDFHDRRCKHCDHENDWDSTIFVVFNKNDFNKPTEIRFARHWFIKDYSWDDVERINDTHVVVYVAEGSHGAYSSLDMAYWDTFKLGGKQLSPDNFNWYYIITHRGCFEEKILSVAGITERRVFCNLQPKLIKGEAQPYPQEWEEGFEGYWPREFFGEGRQPGTPWIRKEWDETRPKGWPDWLEFGVECSVDLHIYDPLNRHVGINYETNEPEIEIPEAEYSKFLNGQYIFIPNPIDGDYKIEIIGTGEGSYNLFTIRSKDEEIVYWKEIDGIPINNNETHAFLQTLIPWMMPKYLKETSITKLEDVKTGDKKIDKEIDIIINHIKNSLEDKNSSLWLDDWHLNPELRNIRVFMEELAAVKRMLQDIEKTKLSPESKEVFKSVINNLIQADKFLARTIIEDAKVTDVKNLNFQKIVNYLIEKAEEEYNKGLKELEKSSEKRPPYQERAIMRFSKAWLFGQLAIKLAIIDIEDLRKEDFIKYFETGDLKDLIEEINKH
jgi:parallel beta-helix repeat protein